MVGHLQRRGGCSRGVYHRLGSEPYGLCQLSKWTKGVRSPLLVRYTMFINQREPPDAQATPQRQTALPAQRR